MYGTMLPDRIANKFNCHFKETIQTPARLNLISIKLNNKKDINYTDIYKH